MNEGHQDFDIVYGIHSVRAALKHRPGDIYRLYVDSDNSKRLGVILKLAKQKNITVEQVSSSQLRSISSDGVHQGIVARCLPNQSHFGIEEMCQQLSSLTRPPLVLVLDRISDPGNLGACLRGAGAFGVDAVIATRHHSAPLTATARKAAAGAAEFMSFVSVGSLQHALDLLSNRLNLRLVATSVTDDGSSQAPDQFDMHSDGIALIMGGENGGVRRSVLARCDYSVYIPMSDRMDCLNVSAACSILLYEIQRQRSNAR